MGNRSEAGRYAAQVRWGKVAPSSTTAGQKDGYITADHPEFDARLKKGARVRQNVGQSPEWQTVSSRKGDMIYLRPDTFSGYENNAKTFGLHKRFWGTLEIKDDLEKSMMVEPVSKRDYDTQQRRELAEQGKALPDGSFPIVDRADLANAIQAIGRAGNRKMAEEHIRRRAKDLDAMDMLPEWITVSKADKVVLERMHNDALNIMTLPEWIGVIREVAKAGGIRYVDGYAKSALEKAKQSFGGDRSAAGRYAAQQRWAKRTGLSDGAVATKNPAGAGETMSMEKIGQAHNEAIASVGKDSPAGKELVTAQKELADARQADVTGDAFGAWDKASSAEFRVRQIAEARGAKGPVKRLHEMLKRLVLDFTDAFYAEAA